MPEIADSILDGSVATLTLGSFPSRIGNQPCFANFCPTEGQQAVHKVQQRDLLWVPDALAKFDELLHKLEEA